MKLIPYIIIVVVIIIFWSTLSRLLNNSFEKNDLKNFALGITGTFIIKASLNNKIIDVNESFVTFTCYKKDEVINKLFLIDLINDSSEKEYNDFISKLYEKQFSKGNVNMQTKDEKAINIDIVGKLYHTNLEKSYYTFVCSINREKSNDDVDIVDDNNIVLNSGFSYFKLDDYDNKEKIVTLKERYSSIVNSVDIGMLEINLVNNSFYYTDRFKEIINYEGETDYYNLDTKLMDYISDLIITDDYYKLLKTINSSIENLLNEFKINIRLQSKNNETRWVDFLGKLFYEDGKIIKMICILNDITYSKIYQNKINKLAYSDQLTNLNNRAYMEERANSILKGFPNEKCALILFDIDDFRFVNDSFGHDVGDKVIKEIGKRLSLISQDKKCIISRFSGDEMGIFYVDYKSKEEVMLYVKNLKDTLNENYNEIGIAYNIAVSVGISFTPEHGVKFDELYKHTEIAMKEAKDTGKNKHLVFNRKMKESLEKRVNIENDLRLSLENEKDMFIYLQPQYRIDTKELWGFEALMRWKDRSGKFISPSIFIPIAEESRLIIPLGNWILKKSCKILRQLEKDGYNDLKISINLSPVELLDGFLVDNIKNLISKEGISPKNLILEITETAVMENLTSNIKKLFDLRNLGINIALDDFGTGYSSLTYLKILPISIIKIDKSFIDDVTFSEIDKNIIEKIIELSHILDLTTIIEGVESIEQLDFVKSIGCDIVQGYFVSGKPVDAKRIKSILKSEHILEKI